MQDITFKGWVSVSATSPLTYTTYEPKTFANTDVDIAISHCGICGSDIHTLRSGWGPTKYPCVVGHEIIGHIIRVGPEVPKLNSPSQGLKVGDRVGVGAQSGSCLRVDCEECSSGLDNYCSHMTGTYNGKYPDGSKSYGGYADYWRGPAWFVFKIPDGLSSAVAAPLLCGGATVFSPLLRGGAGPGKSVGIIGIGGLGHMGLLFAKAMKCDKVVAISRTSSKKSDALTGLGADVFIATDEEKNWAKAHSRTLDLIICTVSSGNMPVEKYLRLLRRGGEFIQVGAPEDPFPGFRVGMMMGKGLKIGASAIGSTEEIRAMLKLASEKNIHPWVQERPMWNVNQALVDMHEGKARYRYVLVNGTESKIKL
ncbi:NADP-dependent alcohol dehydrogenase 6 [Nannizzia gypsea CBS 118893]|uniref:alcohol dehydrogenase (NADP(+)) n=1 Tax=Arthroderma gypseum (strain ATCC MYA-4604 / CBS 118893) TaxID=535722 RepID=E4V313_ARTGP|nr:NADP-dependent alcohol dehydrogenase 6 [Nannizzia gypsea CBS 118893]EFR04387.1 NADP-dependent alcohol dehydrogenase 6 [Nannizzia gypsea CBS 118893]